MSNLSNKLQQEVFSAASLVQKKPENKDVFLLKKNRLINKSRALLGLKKITFPLTVITYTTKNSYAKLGYDHNIKDNRYYYYIWKIWIWWAGGGAQLPWDG